MPAPGQNIVLDVKLADLKKEILEREKLAKLIGRARLQMLLGIGGYVMKTARNSMRKTHPRTVSAPGEPPRSHGQQLLKKLILFDIYRPHQSVVIGPIPISGTDGAPNRLEFGGTRIGRIYFSVRRPSRDKKSPYKYVWTEVVPLGEDGLYFRDVQPRVLKARGGKRPVGERVTIYDRRKVRVSHPTRGDVGKVYHQVYQPRPYMRPALEKTAARGKFPLLFKQAFAA